MMSANDRRVFAMALVLVALMSIFVPVASAVSQTWYLCTDLSLDKTAPGSDTYDFTGWKCWDAGPAECDLTMGAGNYWTLYLNYDAPCDGELGVEVSRDNELPYLAYDHDIAISSAGNTITVDMTGISVDFNTGDHLELWMNWVPSTSGDLTVNCGGSESKLSSPSSDPGFPVPEMSTLVLFSIGLLALAGYVVYRRRDR